MAVKQQRLMGLDGLRALGAVIIAFFWHYACFFETMPLGRIWSWGYTTGWNMNNLFFAVSGFVMFFTYGDRLREGDIGFRNFLVARSSTVFPVHWIGLAIVTGIGFLPNAWTYLGLENTIPDVLLSIPLMQSGWFNGNTPLNVPTWFLSVTMLLYILFFIAFSNAQKNYLRNTLMLLYAAIVIYMLGTDGPFINNLVGQGMMGFFSGVLLGALYRFCKEDGKHLKVLRSICAALVIVTLVIPFIIGFEQVYANAQFLIMFTSMVVYPALIITVVEVGPITKLLSVKPLTYLGGISFSIYILHYPISMIIRNVEGGLSLSIDYSNGLVYLAYIAIVIGVSALIHQLVAIPAQKYIRSKLTVKEAPANA